jgi:hypothetical protein
MNNTRASCQERCAKTLVETVLCGFFGKGEKHLAAGCRLHILCISLVVILCCSTIYPSSKAVLNNDYPAANLYK